ncbi:hypothetical protein HPB48_000346 [Haemaphysalis longicornis]|uniref:Tick transposon n=1 Tax=Haemaphysalis longicornis TaxID=44386 RepID=A0A9J6G887_HAELO|nr:hypothetical protein HPB48_000346 [Haemaphysalis longicornis]
MNPAFHQARRLARAKALHKAHASHPTTLYVHVAEYPDRAACVAIVVNSGGNSVASCSVSTPHPEVGEEVAFALALTAAPATAIISDLQMALRNFATGFVSPITARILRTAPTPPAHCPRLIWAPAHSSLPGNKLANELARDFCCRDASDAASPPRAGGRDRLVRYRDIPQHYRLSRMHFPGPAITLKRRQSAQWRRLQTNTFPHPALCHFHFLTRYCHTCTWCGAPFASLHHMVGACPSKPPLHATLSQPITTLEQWEATLLSSDTEVQECVIQVAEPAAGAHGFLPVGKGTVDCRGS